LESSSSLRKVVQEGIPPAATKTSTLVQRRLEPNCWLRQRRRWIKSWSLLNHYGTHLVFSIVSNGWMDATCHPLINFMVSSLNGPVFLKVVDALGKYKDVQYMGEFFIKVIEDIGVDSCMQIITDNTPVCKVVGTIVETGYPQIFCTPCIVHSLNLALNSIASNVTWMGSLIEDTCHIRNFAQNHTNALTIYKEYTHLSLLKIANTQFASSFIMLKRLREVKIALGSMVISEFWSF
jgi:hypothetical protein